MYGYRVYQDLRDAFGTLGVIENDFERISGRVFCRNCFTGRIRGPLCNQFFGRTMFSLAHLDPNFESAVSQDL